MKIRITVITAVLLICFACDQALEEDLRTKKVNLLAPVNGLITSDTLHTFYWEQMEGAKQYQIQIVSPRMDSIVRLIADIKINQNFHSLDMNPGKYQWRVRALNNGSMSDFSNISTFEIQ